MNDQLQKFVYYRVKIIDLVFLLVLVFAPVFETSIAIVCFVVVGSVVIGLVVVLATVLFSVFNISLDAFILYVLLRFVSPVLVFHHLLRLLYYS